MVSFITLLLAATASFTVNARNVPRQTSPWLTLPPTPALPAPINQNLVQINGVKLWMQKYNEKANSVPIVMSHGGLGYSAYFGDVIQRLVNNGHYVIAIDRRGHGRSTFNPTDKFTYSMFAQDTAALLKAANVPKYVYVGWSDGAIEGLFALMDPQLSAPIQQALLFGTTIAPADTNPKFMQSAMLTNFVTRVSQEYKQLQPNANFALFANKVNDVESNFAPLTAANLAKIDGSKVLVVEAEHEEAVIIGTGQKISKAIPNSSFMTLPGVSHFAPMQNPDQFTKLIENFLVTKKRRNC